MMRSPHVFVVDDDTKIRHGVAKFLGEQGMRVTAAADGREMFDKLAGASVDLIVLDVMLPGEDGLSLLRKLRAESVIPVILLTALAGETDRIVGLEIGAEDYVCKPFSLRELLARIRVVLRRDLTSEKEIRSRANSVFHFEDWRLNTRARTLNSPNCGFRWKPAGDSDLMSASVPI
jgi:two-component system OmpR family response regulator